MVVGLLPRVLLLPSIKANWPLIIIIVVIISVMMMMMMIPIMIAVPQCSLAKGKFFVSSKYFCLIKIFLSQLEHFNKAPFQSSILINSSFWELNLHFQYM